MIDLTRRTVLVGSGAAAMTSAIPGIAQKALMPPVRMVEANGMNLAVYEAGSGPAVVLLHGFPGLAFTWRHQIPALAAAGYRVIVPDLRGYGLTDAPHAVEEYDVTHLTGDLVGLLDVLGVEKAIGTDRPRDGAGEPARRVPGKVSSVDDVAEIRRAPLIVVLEHPPPRRPVMLSRHRSTCS